MKIWMSLLLVLLLAVVLAAWVMLPWQGALVLAALLAAWLALTRSGRRALPSGGPERTGAHVCYGACGWTALRYP